MIHHLELHMLGKKYIKHFTLVHILHSKFFKEMAQIQTCYRDHFSNHQRWVGYYNLTS